MFDAAKGYLVMDIATISNLCSFLIIRTIVFIPSGLAAENLARSP